MVPNELQVTPEQLDVVSYVAAVVLIVATAWFFSYLRGLENYARCEGWRHELR